MEELLFMSMLDDLQKQYYEEFKGLGSPEIVRNNQENDAFELVVLKILYGRILDISFDKDHLDELQKYVIAPKDGGIDIFIERGNGDESSFDVVQVKKKDLPESVLRDCFTIMERVISDFCDSPLNIDSDTCRAALSESSLDNNNRKNCQFFVVHTGVTREFSGIKDNEHIITSVDLLNLVESQTDKVEEDVLSLTEESGCMPFGQENDELSAIVCNINGYDLAMLNNKYFSTEIGRNILFGHNLRESLNPKSSKSFAGMKKTIEKSPEKFWYYNNGITIIAEGFETKKNDQDIPNSIVLKHFSIVNGAQTTSSLGLILQEAKANRDNGTIENLKKSYVIARILKVNDSDLEEDIAICNNTQNPISSRDMVANSIEQKTLYNKLIDESYPQIYMEIKRGTNIPQRVNRTILHRKTTNETLAQLAYAGFCLEPFTAKDKKAELFTNDISQSEYTMNKIYHRVFNLDDDETKNGVLFRKNKSEIDELLFSHYMYKEGKKYLKSKINNRLTEEREQFDKETDIEQKSQIKTRIDRDDSMLEAVGVCMFYFVSTYYEFIAQYGSPWKAFRYDFEKIYQDKNYKQEIVSAFADFFLVKTVEILILTAKENGKSNNINNWVRSSTCQTKFFEKLRSNIGFDMSLSSKFEELMQRFKVVPQ